MLKQLFHPMDEDYQSWATHWQANPLLLPPPPNVAVFKATRRPLTTEVQHCMRNQTTGCVEIPTSGDLKSGDSLFCTTPPSPAPKWQQPHYPLPLPTNWPSLHGLRHMWSLTWSQNLPSSLQWWNNLCWSQKLTMNKKSLNVEEKMG